MYIKGRGAQFNPVNPFTNEIKEHSYKEYIDPDRHNKTKYIETYPKTIINKVPSPDVPMNYGINPYQGCEHGCVYCFARNTHPYWGYSAGLDFESVILVKKNAPQLLKQKLSSKSWQGEPVMFSGNTDCYQPIEKKLQISRQCLQIFLSFKNPVGLITKNKLMLRDLDILKELNQDNLVRVAVSINTLDDTLRSKLEPRASSIKTRLELIETLAAAGIPVTAMLAPIIPGLNDSEIFQLVKRVASLGAQNASYIIVRLNGDIKDIFEDWLDKTFPDRKDKVMNFIAAAHGGKYNDSRFGTRMRGEGKYVDMIGDQFKLAKQKFLKGRHIPDLNRELFKQIKNPQLSLWS